MFLLLVCLALVTLTISTSADLNPSQFDSEVLQGNAVWVVKFYSAMCGSCQEFAPTWKSLSSKITNVVFGEVNIDEKEGMELANRLGALAEGIPNVQVFAKAGSDKGVSIFNGITLIFSNP